MTAGRSARKPSVESDPVLEALVELARSAIRNDIERRAKITVVQGGRKNAA